MPQVALKGLPGLNKRERAHKDEAPDRSKLLTLGSWGIRLTKLVYDDVVRVEASNRTKLISNDDGVM